MELIHILENYVEEEYVPNFTMHGGISAGSSSSTISKVALAALPIVSLPISLLIGAAVASPLIYKAITNDDTDSDEILGEAEAEALKVFLEKHGVSKNTAISKGYIFPPGHPIIGQSYRLHPLAEYSNAEKENTYIPENNYDDVLLEEREAELLKMLVSLGATRIEISQKTDDNSSKSISAGVSVDAGPIGGGDVSGEKKSENTIQKINSRVFELSGKPWKYNDVLNKGDFAWLPYEPSWDALIVARELGGCTSASIEIKENSTYSEDKKLSAGAKAKIYAARGQVSRSNEEEQNKVYTVDVSFSKASE